MQAAIAKLASMIFPVAPQQPGECAILRLSEVLALAMSDEASARSFFTEAGANDVTYVSAVRINEGGLSPCTLGELYCFGAMVQEAASQGKAVVVCSGQDAEVVTLCSLYLGCYMISWQDASAEDMVTLFGRIAGRLTSFRDLSGEMGGDAVTIFDCFEAIFKARALRWVDLAQEDSCDSDAISMEEYFTYGSPYNGALHVIVPSKIVAFPCPRDLPPLIAEEEEGAQTWSDLEGERYFSAEFYATLLCDYDVQVIVCSGSDQYDATGFGRADIDVEDFGRDHSASLLGQIDRFLTLAQVVPGAIGVHSTGDLLDRHMVVLICAYLVRQHRFGGKAAIAWIRMVQSPLVDSGVRFSSEGGTDSEGSESSARLPQGHRPAAPVPQPIAGEVAASAP